MAHRNVSLFPEELTSQISIILAPVQLGPPWVQLLSHYQQPKLPWDGAGARACLSSPWKVCVGVGLWVVMPVQILCDVHV